MKKSTSWAKIGGLVRRSGGQHYLMLVLVSLAFSVIGTRVFLQLTSFPQFGGGRFHLAHVLWGGLLLFGAAIMPLIFANRSVLSVSAILTGLGMGLFIDEVGKFISLNNDYFYPPALPIIYAFFLLTLMLYRRLRRPTVMDRRTLFYSIWDKFAEIFDHDLDQEEHQELTEQLKNLSDQKEDPELANLAQKLLLFLKSPTLNLPSGYPPWTQRSLMWAQKVEEKIFSRGGLKLGLITCWLFMGIEDWWRLITQIEMPDSRGEIWFLIRRGLEAIIAVAFFAAARLMKKGQEKKAISLAYFSILVSLTMVNLLVFYQDQARAIVGTLGQSFVLLLVIRYQQRFL
ncbi:MAG: hypothetical protein ABH807_01250 [Candidatus Shapirobacteria bacterium]